MMPILIVEDDEIDTEALTRAFSRQQIKNPVFVAHDGVEALALLQGSSGQEQIPQPCLMILDINMPRMNGLELLESIQRDEALQENGNVAIVLTTSARDEDKTRAYQNRAAGYFLKDNLPAVTDMIGLFCQGSKLSN